MVVAVTVQPTIQLDPADWMLATWRPYTPLPRPPIPAFDQEAACARLEKRRGGYSASWKTLYLSPTMSRKEAHFWLLAMTREYDWQSKESHTAFLMSRQFDGSLTPTFIEKLLVDSRQYWRVGSEIMIPLANLLSLPDLFTLLNNVTVRTKFHTEDIVAGFREYILPYLTPDDRALVRDVIREHVVNSSALPSGPNQSYSEFSPYIAALVGGFSREIEAKLSILPDNCYYQPEISPYSTYYMSVIDAIFGLDDPTLVERETRRLGHALVQPHQVAGWLAHTETRALDWIYQSIIIAHKDVAEPLFKVFAKVEDEASVPHMLRLQHDSPVVLRAVEWLRSRPELGTQAAAVILTDETSDPKTRREARDYLLGQKRSGYDLSHIHLTDEAAQTYFQAEILDSVESALPPLTAETTPTWLADAVTDIQKGKRFKIPAWLDIGDLPALRLNTYALNGVQVTALLAALSRSTLDAPHPFVKAVKTHLDPISCDAFAYALFEMWLDRGASSKDKWAFLAVGLLGGDASVMKLAPLIRKWPGEAQHQRAITGLACLRAIGSDTALTQINNIGQKVKFTALKTAARNAIEAIAIERGMSREELADRIVPDCGLDADGRRTFSYGARQFTLAINSELKPVIRLEDGKLKPDLPKPTSQDDPDQASIAQAEWKLIKKQVRDVAKAQAERLETAMMARRMWTPDNFKRFLVDHPLMTHLVRSLVWGGYDEARKLITTFRVTDEKDYASVDDEPVTLDGIAWIGLVHPLQLTQAQISAWGQVLSDYDRVPPFTQLGRKIYALNEDEKEATEITRYAQTMIEPVVFVGVLQKLGWTRGSIGDGGVFYEFVKQFPVDNMTAVIEFPGVPVGYYQGWQNISVTRCVFLPGIYQSVYTYPNHKNTLTLSKVDPVVMSEVLRDLSLLAHKGEK